MKFTHSLQWTNLSNGLRGETLRHGKSNTTKVWVPQPLKKQKNISRKLTNIKLNLNMSTTKMMRWLILHSIRKWLIKERIGLQPIQSTTMSIIQRSTLDTVISLIKSWSNSPSQTVPALFHRYVMVWSLASARYYLLASRESSRVKSRSRNWVAMLLSTQHTITESSHSARLLLLWLKTSSAAIMSIFYCLSVSSVQEIKEARRLHHQDTSSQVWIQWPELCSTRMMMQY